MKNKLIALGLSFCLVGCASVGPGRMPSERQDYNEAMANSNNQQLLLNIVRLHDGVPPLFLEISNISTQATLSASTGAIGSFSHAVASSVGTDTTTVNAPNFGWSETPTVSYSPLQGSNFANHLLEPLPLQYIYFLCRGGWPIDQVFDMTLEDLNNHPNVLESSPASYHVHHKDFDQILADLRELQVHDALRFFYSIYHNHDEIPIMVIRVLPEGKKMQAWKDLSERLHLKPGRTQLVLSEYYPAYPGGEINVETRSFFGVLTYLSASVPPLSQDARMHPWLSIQSSDKTPKESYLQVYYRQHWYYIDEEDQNSKMTMLALFELFQLATGEGVKTNPPVLTLPLR